MTRKQDRPSITLQLFRELQGHISQEYTAPTMFCNSKGEVGHPNWRIDLETGEWIRLDPHLNRVHIILDRFIDILIGMSMGVHRVRRHFLYNFIIPHHSRCWWRRGIGNVVLAILWPATWGLPNLAGWFVGVRINVEKRMANESTYD